MPWPPTQDVLVVCCCLSAPRECKTGCYHDTTDCTGFASRLVRFFCGRARVFLLAFSREWLGCATCDLLLRVSRELRCASNNHRKNMSVNPPTRRPCLPCTRGSLVRASLKANVILMPVSVHASDSTISRVLYTVHCCEGHCMQSVNRALDFRS